MKPIAYVNGMRIKGKASNVGRMKATKWTAAGAVVMAAAPKATTTITGFGTGTVNTTIKLGLTGGRNFICGKVQAINTGANKVSMTVKAKTPGGTGTLKAAATGTPSAKFTKTAATAVPFPIVAPGSLIVKAVPVAGKIGTIKALTMSVNDMTTMLM